MQPMPQDSPAGAHPTPQAQPIRVAAAGDPKADEAYSKQIGDLFSQWGGRAPRTDVVLPPSDENGRGASEDEPAPARGPAPAGSDPRATSRKSPSTPPAAAPVAAAAEILPPWFGGRDDAVNATVSTPRAPLLRARRSEVTRT